VRAIVPLIFIVRRSLQETDEFLASRNQSDMREIFHSMIENRGIVIVGADTLARGNRFLRNKFDPRCRLVISPFD
jgi:hypothetical protein